MKQGSLIVVGTGIEAIGQVTLAAQRAMEGADELLYLVPDPVTQEWIEGLNPVRESLQDMYVPGRDRALIYGAITARMLREVRNGRRVCAALYGHPGVFVHSGHAAVRAARAEGHRARMLAAVSAEDCLFADLGVDPGLWGRQSYEATNFLMRRRVVDVSAPLVLWQIGLIGIFDHGQDPDRSAEGLRALADILGQLYGEEHEVLVYEASLLGICDPRIDSVPIHELPSVEVSSASTLFVPPSEAVSWDTEMLDRLGIDVDQGKQLEREGAGLYAPPDGR